MKLKSFDYDTSLRVRLAYEGVQVALGKTHLDEHKKAAAKTRIVSALIDAAERGERDIVRLRTVGIEAIEGHRP